MSPDEALKLCRLAKAASPAQAVDEYTPELWALALQRERFADAQQALVELSREQEWIHVSHIVKRVKRIRHHRVEEFGPLPDPPAICAEDPAEYMRWYRETVRAIADGEHVDRLALSTVSPEHRERLRATLDDGFGEVSDA